MTVLVKKVQEDYIWTRVSERIITGAPDRSLNIVITEILKCVSW